MVCEQAKNCDLFDNSSYTCKVANGGPRNALGHAYCGQLRKIEANQGKRLVLVEA
jgi:hypothetical protein